MIPLANKEASTIIEAFLPLRSQYSEHFDEVFKTVTTDNGSEFANLSQLDGVSNLLLQFTILFDRHKLHL